LKSDTKANGVLIGYSKSGILTENDRKIIVETVIKWLLQITELYVYSFIYKLLIQFYLFFYQFEILYLFQSSASTL